MAPQPTDPAARRRPEVDRRAPSRAEEAVAPVVARRIAPDALRPAGDRWTGAALVPDR